MGILKNIFGEELSRDKKVTYSLTLQELGKQLGIEGKVIFAKYNTTNKKIEITVIE